MRTLSAGSIVISLVAFTSLASAWPWHPSIQDLTDVIVRRQDNNNDNNNHSEPPNQWHLKSQRADIESPTDSDSSTSNSQTGASQTSATGSGSSASASATTTGSSQSGSSSGSITSGSSQTGSGTSSGTSKSTNASKTTKSSSSITNIDPRLPAGGVQMITPSALAQQSFYKIGDQVTFAWNYTSLSVTPSAIDVVVSCQANSATYTLTNNASVASTGSITWDTQHDATGVAPLLTETYTLVIHDAAKDVTAVASAGYLGSYDQFTFGMYLPQSYTPLGGKQASKQQRRFVASQFHSLLPC